MNNWSIDIAKEGSKTSVNNKKTVTDDEEQHHSALFKFINMLRKKEKCIENKDSLTQIMILKESCNLPRKNQPQSIQSR